MRGRSRRGERGAATAELVMSLPVLVAVTLALVWLLSVGVAQLRTVDAAREAARALARGDDRGAALAAGKRVGVAGTSLTASTSSGRVVVEADAHLDGPLGLFARLGGVRLHASAVAAMEQP
jgi:Flp pilus assembly protein TadG